MKKSDELRAKVTKAKARVLESDEMTPLLEEWFASALANVETIAFMEELEEMGLVSRRNSGG